MADMMSAQEHYDAGMTELVTAGTHALTDPETSQADATRAQAHFQAGLLSAVLEDLAARGDQPDDQP